MEDTFMENMFDNLENIFYIMYSFLSITPGPAAPDARIRAAAEPCPIAGAIAMKRPLVFALAQDATPKSQPQANAPQSNGPKAYDFRDGTSDEMAVWINDPNMHAFYQATVEAFAQGPAKLDRAAYDKRFHKIFLDFAVAHK